MKIMTLISSTLLCALLFSSQTAFAGSLTAEREARTQKIEALQKVIRDGRISRSKRVQAKLDLARLQAEARKDRRNGGK